MATDFSGERNACISKIPMFSGTATFFLGGGDCLALKIESLLSSEMSAAINQALRFNVPENLKLRLLYASFFF